MISDPSTRRNLTRRRLLASAGALSGLSLSGLGLIRPLAAQELPEEALQAEAIETLPEAAPPFSFDWLTEIARNRAAEPDPAAEPQDPLLASLNYDDYQRIAFRPDRAVWASEQAGWQLQPFHTGWLFDRPVNIHEVVGEATERLEFTAADFEYREGISVEIPQDFALPGVAGFKLTYPLNRADLQDEVASFLGASYFRALGQGNRYGLSARGLAIDSGLPRPEEFPRFSEFWIERPAPGARAITFWALMDSARVTGAWQFRLAPGQDTTMDVTARLFFREEVFELGIAPLVSMFLYGGINRSRFNDFRPQVHDSDGLRIVRENGDVIWRALSNPLELQSSYFAETRPRRFGLHQRSRDFEDFEDAGARYDLRPSLDVEPLGDWGAGQVRLFEIPTNLEVHDNIGAFWIPAEPIRAGDTREFSYRLHWGALEPQLDPELAWVANTLAGQGGAAGIDPPPDTRKFVIDFEGGLLGATPEGNPDIRPVVNITGGEAQNIALSKLPDTNRWRLAMDIASARGELVELNAHIAGANRKLSEIWTIQWRKE